MKRKKELTRKKKERKKKGITRKKKERSDTKKER